MDVVDQQLRRIRVAGARVDRADPTSTDPRSTEPRRRRSGGSVSLVVPGARVVELTGQGGPRAVRPGQVALLHGAAQRDGSWATIDAEPAGSEPSLLVVTARVRGEAGKLLLRALPPVLVTAVVGDDAHLWHHLEQVVGESPGAVGDRMFELLLIRTLRRWLDDAGSEDESQTEASRWQVAMTDPHLSRALQAIHDHPERRWTVEALAALSGTSRSAFSQRFTATLGQPPLTYVTRLRMGLAADSLAESSKAVSKIAGDVGYAGGFGFSAAFKREQGMSPTAYRSCAASPECLTGAC